MKTHWNPKRRRFLAGVALSAVSTAACGRPALHRFSFTPEEARLLEVLCDEIIPPDDEFPGAAWAGAVNYIARQLNGPLRSSRRAYREGLARVEAASRHQFGVRFEEMEKANRISLMEAMENGGIEDSSWSRPAQIAFFRMVVNHTMQAYYGDPRHGGNRDQVGYRLVGLPLTCVRGREHHDLTQIRMDALP